MNSVNKIILLGNVGKTPEVRSFQSGGRSCSFGLATSDGWKDKASGEWKSRTTWHNIVIFNENIIKFAEKHVQKGSKVYVEGQIETREYTDKEGVKRQSVEVVLRPFKGELLVLDHKDNSVQPSEDDDGSDDIPF